MFAMFTICLTDPWKEFSYAKKRTALISWSQTVSVSPCHVNSTFHNLVYSDILDQDEILKWSVKMDFLQPHGSMSLLIFHRRER